MKAFWKRTHTITYPLSHGLAIGYGADKLAFPPRKRVCDFTSQQWNVTLWVIIQHITQDEVFSQHGPGVRRCAVCIIRYNQWARFKADKG